MLGHALVVVSDAHLGGAPPAVEEGLLSFLEAVPDLGDCLLVNGDLFDFWFSYARVIPRRGFHVAAALARLRRRVPIVMVGGNHDRWGGDFWERDVGAQFDPQRLTFEIGSPAGGRDPRGWADGARMRATLLHRAINHPITAAVYRAIHPEIGLRIVDCLSPRLGDHTPDPGSLAEAAARQAEWATRLLAAEPELGLVVMGHTHLPALAAPMPGRQYLNPGAWFDGFRYAVATERGAELRTFSPAAPPPPAPAAPR